MCAYDEDLPPFDSAQRSLRKNTMLNILTEPVIRLDLSGGVRKDANLPEVFAALVSDKVVSFPALRPHQRHAWHAFLVQLGAMAMHRAGGADLPDIADEWAKLIRGLTPDFPEDEPWQLVVEDITKPAFMQAPASSKEKEKDFKAVAATPDELDILVTSKNHDLKSSVASRAVPGDWLFALVTLQTMEGFGGAGNYGVSRMNGGFGSRPAFTLAPVEGLGAHLRMDIVTLLDQMGSLAREFPMRPGGIGLVWTVPWDGARVEELLLERLHPFYIEVCRRIRLRPGPEGNLAAVRTSSKAARIEARNLNGRTGDPWTPVNTKDGKSLTLASEGLLPDSECRSIAKSCHRYWILQYSASRFSDLQRARMGKRWHGKYSYNFDRQATDVRQLKGWGLKQVTIAAVVGLSPGRVSQILSQRAL